jgi:hypothetical protein
MAAYYRVRPLAPLLLHPVEDQPPGTASLDNHLIERMANLTLPAYTNGR